MIIASNSVDQSIYFKLVDPTGVPETGLVITALSAAYIRDRAAAVTAALTALALPTTAHTDNYGIEVSTTNAPGLYRIDFVDAAFASGVARVQLGVVGAAIDPAYIEVELSPWLTPITGATVRAVNGADAALAIPGSAMTLANDAITAAKIAADAIGASELAVDAVAEIAAAAWAYASRTLTQTAAQVAAIVAGSTISARRGDTLSCSITGLGSISGRQKLWFTAKRAPGDADTAALLQIEEGTGLTYINGVAGTAADGSISVTSAASGNITITAAASAMSQLDVGRGRYDIQWKTAASVITTLSEGTWEVVADQTRAVS